MADSWKAMDLNKFIVHDAIADDILDDLLKREWEKQKRVKYDKRKVTQMKIQDLLEKRIEKARQHLNKEKLIMHINKGKEKMVMERVTSDESSDDTLKSSSEDTCSYDCTWEQKKLLKNQGLDLRKRKKHFEDEVRTIYKGRRGSSFRNAAITKTKKPKSRSKHLAPTTPRTGSTCTTVVVQTKRPPPVTNSVLGLAAVTTWQQIMNKEFGMKRSKENVGGSSNVRMKGKRKMM
ncbi:hypothetical protein Tco_0313931 [Tanacetum coccineum]